jgi:hypothetical protein
VTWMTTQRKANICNSVSIFKTNCIYNEVWFVFTALRLNDLSTQIEVKRKLTWLSWLSISICRSIFEHIACPFSKFFAWNTLYNIWQSCLFQHSQCASIYHSCPLIFNNKFWGIK